MVPMYSSCSQGKGELAREATMSSPVRWSSTVRDTLLKRGRHISCRYSAAGSLIPRLEKMAETRGSIALTVTTLLTVRIVVDLKRESLRRQVMESKHSKSV
jgi:hypothetical protein